MGILARAIALASFNARRFRRRSRIVAAPADATPAPRSAETRRPVRRAHTNVRGFAFLAATAPLWIATWALLSPDEASVTWHAARAVVGLAVERGVLRGGPRLVRAAESIQWKIERADREERAAQARRDREARLAARRDPG